MKKPPEPKTLTFTVQHYHSIDGDGGRFTAADRRRMAEAKAIAQRELRKARRAGREAPQGDLELVRGFRAPAEDGNNWSDVSHRLLHAPFALLRAFVEWELYNPRNVQVEWEHDAGFRHSRREIDSLYLYWMRDRPKLTAEIERLQSLACRGVRRLLQTDPVTNAEGKVVGKKVRPLPAKSKRIYADSFKLEHKRQDLDDKALCRLMLIRGVLWT